MVGRTSVLLLFLVLAHRREGMILGAGNNEKAELFFCLELLYLYSVVLLMACTTTTTSRAYYCDTPYSTMVLLMDVFLFYRCHH